MTDASDIAVGAFLQQCIGKDWCPISYFSKKLKPDESWYSTFDWELIAVNLSIKYFWHFVEGRTFHVLMGPNLFKYVLSSHSDTIKPQGDGNSSTGPGTPQAPVLTHSQTSTTANIRHYNSVQHVHRCTWSFRSSQVPLHIVWFPPLTLSSGYDIGHDSVSNPRPSNTTATPLSTFVTPDARFDNMPMIFLQTVTPISLLALNLWQAGLKPSLLLTSQQRQLKLCKLLDLPQLIKDVNLNQNSGNSSCNFSDPTEFVQ